MRVRGCNGCDDLLSACEFKAVIIATTNANSAACNGWPLEMSWRLQTRGKRDKEDLEIRGVEVIFFICKGIFESIF